jgi:hypothetical protein
MMGANAYFRIMLDIAVDIRRVDRSALCEKMFKIIGLHE